jgi:membrane-bound metal-dependent hydrolase YbcI (DUF457 family)
MDNVTHTLFALTLARTPLGRIGRGATAALVVASNAPDIDVISAAAGNVGYLTWHRGPTHGLVGIVGLGFLTALLVRAASGRGAHGTDRLAPLPALVVVATIGVLMHVLMDFPTSYGTRLLSPFDWRWVSIDWMPIIDIYLLVVLAAGLAFGRVSPEARRRNTAIVLVLMAANYGVRGYAHHRALAIAPRLFGPTLPPSCDSAEERRSLVNSWPRAAAPSPPPGRRCLIEIAALPTFVSPFKWRLVAQLSNALELHEVDLLDRRFQSPAPASEVLWRKGLRYPNVWTPAVARAATTRSAQAFLGFSRFPVARSAVDRTGVTTVRWNDGRFLGGTFTLEEAARRPGPFSLIIRVSPDGQILQEEMGR